MNNNALLDRLFENFLNELKITNKKKIEIKFFFQILSTFEIKIVFKFHIYFVIYRNIC